MNKSDEFIESLAKKARTGEFPRTDVADKVLLRIREPEPGPGISWAWGYLSTASAVLAVITVWTSSSIYQIVSDPLTGMICNYLSSTSGGGIYGG